MTQNTVNGLRTHLEDIIIDTDRPDGVEGPTTAKDVLRAMETVARTNLNDRNRVFFTGTQILSLIHI